MKTNLLSLALLPFGLLLFSCDVFDEQVVPKGRVTTQQATFSNYDAIDASSAFTVYLTFSDSEESIEIEANENLHQYIEVKKEHGTLKIGLEDHISVRGNATLNAYITTRRIASFMASGASRFVVSQEIDEVDVYIYLSGASRFSGNVNAGSVIADLSGASSMDLSGYSVDFDVDASGASMVRDFDFVTGYLKADLSGASNVSMTVDEEIDVEASGASILQYKGDAVIIRQDLSGASSVKKM